ncbi:LysR substrate binding domain protein [compost metagenome]
MIASHPGRLPGLRNQMDAVRRKYAASPVIAGEARTLAGYITRVAAGLGVGVADAGHMETLRRTDVVVVPLTENIHVITYVLHQPQSHELRDALQRFVARAKTPH